MNRKLSPYEKNAIKQAYKGHPIWRLIFQGSKELEKDSKHFRFSAEDTFVEAMCIVDNLRNLCSVSEQEQYINSLYDDMLCTYRDWASNDIPGVEVSKAVATVLYVVAFCCLQSKQATYKNTLVNDIFCILSNNGCDLDEMHNIFLPPFYRMDAEQVSEDIDAYLKSEDYISDDTKELLQNLSQEHESETIDIAPNDRLSIRQTLMFATTVLDVSLDATFTNKKQLATFLHQLTGYGVDAIRNKMGKVDYDAAQSKQDGQKLVALLETCAPKTAQKIKNDIEEVD